MSEHQNKAVDFPGKIEEIPGGGIVLTKLDDVINWARSNSLWPVTFATSCCGIEMISASAAKFDIARFGSEVFRATPRQADLMITADCKWSDFFYAVEHDLVLISLSHFNSEHCFIEAMKNALKPRIKEIEVIRSETSDMEVII